jgi:hypothetical protein
VVVLITTDRGDLITVDNSDDAVVADSAAENIRDLIESTDTKSVTLTITR